MEENRETRGMRRNGSGTGGHRHNPDAAGRGRGPFLSRRSLLRMAGAGGLGLLLGAGGSWGVLARTLPKATDSHPASVDSDQVPFYGEHQGGITTPPQDFLCFASFDVTSSRIADLRLLFRRWTEAAAALCSGKPVGDGSTGPNLPPADTGEAIGLSPSRMTITFGVGASLFDSRFGLAAKRPEPLVDLPAFAGEELDPAWCGGDLCVQVCANDLQAAFHAVRNLARIARGTAVLRWTQEGFQRTSAAAPRGETPRNLFGFKDGTGNPDVRDESLMRKVVWVQSSDGPAWMQGGTYMAVRRIRMRLEVWDRSTLAEQEATFGRYRASGAPLGMKRESDPVNPEAAGPDGKPFIPRNSHVSLAHGDGSVRILRRSYSYSSGIDRRTGQLDAGLFFICFQRDPRRQFVPIQQKLAQQDALNEYIVHTGSALFACLPGASRGNYIGQTLLE